MPLPAQAVQPPPVALLDSSRSYLLCCSVVGSPRRDELLVSAAQRIRHPQHLFCCNGRSDSSVLDQVLPAEGDRGEGKVIGPASTIPSAAGGQRVDWERRASGKERAAYAIQTRWRFNRQTRAASRIQGQWRRRSATRGLQKKGSGGCPDGGGAGLLSLEGLGGLDEEPISPRIAHATKTLHQAARQIQRIWRHRTNSRDSSASPPSLAGRSPAQRLDVASPWAGVGPATPRSVRHRPVALPDGDSTPAASPISDAWNQAATLIQSMWRTHSGDLRSSPSPSRRASAEGGSPVARTPLSDAVSDAASRLSRLWRGRLLSSPSTADEDYMGEYGEQLLGGADEAFVDEEFTSTPSSSWWESLSTSATWFAGKVRTGTAAGEPLLKAWWADRKKRALETLVQSSAPVLRRTLADIGEVVKSSATLDPDMWGCVRTATHSAVSEVWNDIEMEIESSLKVSLLDHSTHFDKPPTANGRLSWLFLRFRSWVLFHYLPYNKSIFGKLKDPIYVMMTASTFLPVFGVRVFFFSVVLLMLLFPGPPDEYQLINFVLIFKGTQFFTTGVAMMFLGAMKYYTCYLFHGKHLQSCIILHGPGATDWLSSAVFDYFGSIVLVWVSFLALPRSNVHWSGHRTADTHEVKVYCCCLRGVPTRGGRLRWLLRYDMVSFVLSFAMFIAIYVDSVNEDVDEGLAFIHAKETVFWCRILYSVLSLPFVIFVIPLCGRVLTHSVYTGYNQAGACVEFAFEGQPVAQQPELQEGRLRRPARDE